MSRYEVRDEGGAQKTIEAATADEARAKAEVWLRDGTWDTTDGTAYVSANVWGPVDADGVPIEDAPEEIDEWVEVAIEPDEPECVDDEEHDWQSPRDVVGGIAENPGVWGKGAGVVIRSACVRCGCGRTVDTSGGRDRRVTSYDRTEFVAALKAREEES